MKASTREYCITSHGFPSIVEHLKREFLLHSIVHESGFLEGSRFEFVSPSSVICTGGGVVVSQRTLLNTYAMLRRLDVYSAILFAMLYVRPIRT
jgi:hypothetical protein